MRHIIIAALLLTSAPAMACESYEECMETGDNYAGRRIGPIASLQEIKSAEYLKAIAYKLDEISKKLDLTDDDKKIKQLERLMEQDPSPTTKENR
jgi:hypothetical protein